MTRIARRRPGVGGGPDSASLDDYQARTAAATDLLGLRAALEDFLAAFGFEYFSYVILRPPAGRPIVRFLSSYPSEWIQHYRSKDYELVDPLFNQAGTSVMPYRWDQLMPEMLATERRRNLIGEFIAAGVPPIGMSVPLHGPEGGIAALHMCGRLSEAEMDEIWSLHRFTLCTAALISHDAILRTAQAQSAEDPVELTDRERECLTWTSKGKSVTEISGILRISAATVKFHLRNASEKLDTHSKHHAAVRAVLLGLIMP